MFSKDRLVSVFVPHNEFKQDITGNSRPFRVFNDTKFLYYRRMTSDCRPSGQCFVICFVWYASVLCSIRIGTQMIPDRWVQNLTTIYRKSIQLGEKSENTIDHLNPPTPVPKNINNFVDFNLFLF